MAADRFWEILRLPPAPPRQVLLPWVLMPGKTRGWPARWAWQGMRATSPASEVNFAISNSWLRLSADLQRILEEWTSVLSQLHPWLLTSLQVSVFSHVPTTAPSTTLHPDLRTPGGRLPLAKAVPVTRSAQQAGWATWPTVPSSSTPSPSNSGRPPKQVALGVPWLSCVPSWSSEGLRRCRRSKKPTGMSVGFAGG